MVEKYEYIETFAYAGAELEYTVKKQDDYRHSWLEHSSKTTT